MINKPRLGLGTQPGWLGLGAETDWLGLGMGNDWLGLGTGSDRLGLGKRTYRKVGLSQAGRSVEEVLSPGFLRSAEESPILNAPYTARLLR